jgi:hypothetical protein
MSRESDNNIVEYGNLNTSNRAIFDKLSSQNLDVRNTFGNIGYLPMNVKDDVGDHFKPLKLDIVDQKEDIDIENLFGIKPESTSTFFTLKSKHLNSVAQALYQMMKEAGKSDNDILSTSEFKYSEEVMNGNPSEFVHSGILEGLIMAVQGTEGMTKSGIYKEGEGIVEVDEFDNTKISTLDGVFGPGDTNELKTEMIVRFKSGVLSLFFGQVLVQGNFPKWIEKNKSFGDAVPLFVSSMG